VEALTKQNGVRLLGKFKKKLKKKLKPTSLPMFLQEEIGNPHIFFGLIYNFGPNQEQLRKM
jgi:hypothetical protein